MPQVPITLRCIKGIVGQTVARSRKQMHPGRILREEYMEPMRLDTHGLAAALGVTEGRLQPIISNEEPLTSDLALRLAKCFRTSPKFWLATLPSEHFGSVGVAARCKPCASRTARRDR